jgi:hypothetical protein
MITLRSYQLAIVDRAVSLIRAHGWVYLAMETRTGKSLTALTIANRPHIKRVLFVTKKKAMSSIVADHAAGEFPYSLTCINYEQMHKVAPKSFDLLIIDEMHNFSQFPKPSLRTKRLRNLCVGVPVIMLSGTPILESWSGIYHQMWVLGSRSPYAQWPTFYKWAARFVNVTQARRGNFVVNDYSDCREAEARPYVEPHIIRFTQEEAGFSAPVEEYFHEVEDPIIPAMIKVLWNKKVLNVVDDLCVAESGASMMNKLHQLSGGSIICEHRTHIISRVKAEYIRDNFKGKKICIYYKFIGEFEILKSVFPNYTLRPEEFRLVKDSVFLCHFQSGREGLELSCADDLIMYSIDHAAASYWQTRARIQSLNRTAPARINWIFVKGGIEKKVYACVKQKMNFNLNFFVKNCARDLKEGV